jgi:predicted dienelactone hydrolase
MRLLILALALLASGARAQQPGSFPRADGATVPALVYGVDKDSCRGIALISHGAGGSAKGIAYLAKALSEDRWLAVAVGHEESGPERLRKAIRGNGIREGLLELTTDRAAYAARFLDISAALEWARPRCAGGASALIGHSMGAATAILEAGAKNKLGLAGKDRFDAYVAMSPQGPGSIFPEDAWRAIRKPVLLLTGTRDRALEGPWETRQVAFDDLPAGCAWLGVIEGARHMDFGGRGGSREAESLTIAAVRTFLDGVAAGRCPALPAGEGIAYKHK